MTRRDWLAVVALMVVFGLAKDCTYTVLVSAHRSAQLADLPPPLGRMTTEASLPSSGVAARSSGPDRYPDRSVAAAPPFVAATAKPHVLTVADARRYAIRKLGAAQFACLDELWQRESRWRVNATNQTSGAYGIPQALPGSKMASAGADWRTNPVTQVRWGVQYVNERYGSACGAWSHAVKHGWY